MNTFTVSEAWERDKLAQPGPRSGVGRVAPVSSRCALPGSPENEPGRWEAEGPQHRVTIRKGYWLFDTPCSQALWEAVMGGNPSYFKSADRSVEQVSWNDVQEFFQRINERDPGLDLLLPSEAQWEHACRAGTKTAIYTGEIELLGANNAPALDPIAWYGGNSGVEFDLENGDDSSRWVQKQSPHTRAGTHPVGQKKPNPWGLYDMLGNVFEWVQDPWHADYQSAPEEGIVWESDKSGKGRVVRGGFWGDITGVCRCAFRDKFGVGSRINYLGFRCARVQS